MAYLQLPANQNLLTLDSTTRTVLARPYELRSIFLVSLNDMDPTQRLAQGPEYGRYIESHVHPTNGPAIPAIQVIHSSVYENFRSVALQKTPNSRALSARTPKKTDPNL